MSYSVQRAAELVVEPVAGPAEGQAFQAAVMAVVAFALLVGEITGVNFQAVDFARGEHGTGIALVQQA